MRISDWSSDVCSSDLAPADCRRRAPVYTRHERIADPRPKPTEPPVTDLIDKFPNVYGFGGLDRSAHLRAHEDWLEELLDRPDTRLVPVWRTRSFVLEETNAPPRAATLPVPEPRTEEHHVGQQGVTTCE